ncbi:MAG: hypothetical protein K2F79_04100 [Muribaculaceae bacterium]|nr:hypothetical protein [Muribaculaceae bacterium]
MKSKKLFNILAAVAVLSATLACAGCDTLDDDRVPVTPVQISFNTVADWNFYGVAAALDHRRFIREQRIPSNFPYTAMTYTGFGGVLLTCDVLGTPMAFDLCCPVERQQSVRVHVNPATNLAECDKCGSAYDVFSLPGTPVSGPASRDGYGLRRYRVSAGQGAAYMMVTN